MDAFEEEYEDPTERQMRSGAAGGENMEPGGLKKYGVAIAAGTGAALDILGAFPPTRGIAKAGELGLETLGVIGSTQEGASTREQMMQLGVPSGLATAAGVATGVADFVSPVPIGAGSQVAADPFSTRPIERMAADSPEVASSLQASGKMEPVNIPDPVPAQTGALAAEGFADRRNTARSAAMEGKQTELVDSFFTMNQP
jgi:hypothetical protein